MSSAADPPSSQMEDDSRSREAKPVKEKKRRRRSKQRDSIEAQLAEAEFPLEDDGNNSNSSTPVYERSDDAVYPVGGSVCALCYCGEKSLLGQGDITRYSPSPGFNPFKKPPLRARGSRDILYGSSPGSTGSQESFLAVEKVTKTAAQRRGSKQMREMVKTAPKQVEYVDELSTVGSSEILDVGLVFEATGHVTAHHCCAAWSEGVTQNESYNLLCVDKAVHVGMSQRCHSCSRYGATIKCRSPKCERLFHYPCAAGSGCFQDIKSMSLLCTDHLEMASTIADPDELNCAVCDSPGQISDLLFCTSCGHHYHGDCLYPHVDVNPVVRAGWQCPECKICQTCRQPGDDNKMLVCDVCDKGYHTFCLRPAMSFIPKNGWCCKNCRRCTDCGSRTPGNGPSSRWHINYQVCDKCYQLRNKGHACPVCSKAYRASPAARAEMGLCTSCKKYVHWGCEDAAYLDDCQKSADGYKCPMCRNQVDLPVSNVPETEFSEPVVEQFTTESTSQPDGLAYQSPPNPMITDAEEEKVSEQVMEASIKSEAMTLPQTQTTLCSATRKRASTSSSLGSEKGNFALKGSSLDPMLCVGDDSIDQNTFTRSSDFASPPPKIRHISIEDTGVSKEKLVHQSSSDHNLGHLFSDENAQDTMSLFGVDSLTPSAAQSTPTAPPDVMSCPVETKMFTPDDIPAVASEQSKMSMSPMGSPPPYASPISKPPGPGIGKPGAMFGRGKPFGHKKKPAVRSRGKGKGKGHKRGGFSGARRRPRGGKGNAASPSERTTPRRARRSFHKQPSTSPAVNEEGLSSPVIHTKVEPVAQLAHADDEYGDSMHNTVVLCSTEDTFTLMQDMCVVCGSFGKDAEGRLVSCSQCGQCYHPYCVGLKLTKVVLRKGWRCLDCTVCEECGQVDDPAHLLLCDDCDISYHTHCLKPPLLHVPKGGWKCKWCVRCVHCNSTSPGKNCEWQSNYTSCAPCASANQCPKCRKSYRDDEVIMHCDTCNRWIHATCESLFSEADIEKVLEMGYECYSCRPKDATPPHMVLAAQSDSQDHGNFYMGRTRMEVENVKEYHKDFTQLTITGLRHVQKLMQKYMGLLKKKPSQARGNRNRKPSEVQEKLDTPPVLPTLEIAKPKQDFGQPINVADAVKALQEPSEVYGKLPEVMDAAAPLSEEVQSTTTATTEEPSLETSEKAMGIENVNNSLVDVATAAQKVDVPPPLQLASPDPTKAVLGVDQGGVKKRRKPYRPGIGGFMVRSRGRGGFFKPRSRRGLTQPISKELTGSTKSDQITSGTTSESTATAAPLPAKQGTADTPEQAKVTDPASDPVTSIVSPVTIKVPPTAKPRKKKRMKLIDQFPPYLQDAFFGKDVMAGAEAKSNPLDDLNDKSAPTSKSLEQDGTSKDRITKRIMEEFELRARAAGAAKSHRSAPQEDDVIMMDRENEQELLGVLPDLPFKDDELLGMISSELKQGGGESHGNILSPSSLEKMVGDGFDESDMAALFSDVLNNQNDGATKQTHMPAKNVGPSSGQSHPKTEQIHQHDSRPQSASHTPMDIQQENVSVSQQRQLAIRAELQQIEMKQQRSHAHQQRQHDSMQRQMSVNIPSGYGISQHEQNMQQPHQNMNIEQPRSIPAPTGTSRQHNVPMMPQHPMDPSRPRSHQGAMSPALLGSTQHTLPMNQRVHQGHSPHPTPPPAMFSRQASVPVLPVMQNQSSMQSDTLGAHLMPTQMQSRGITNMMSQQSHPKGPVRAQSMIAIPTSIVDGSSISPGLFQGSDVLHGPVPVSMKPTCVTMPGPIPPTTSPHKPMVKNSTTNLLQPTSGYMMSMQNVPSESYSTSQPIAVQTPTVSPVITHKRSSSVPIVSHAESGNNSNAPSSQMQPVGADPSSQGSDRTVIPARLPNFSNESIFEPSPPPWPLGTELDGESQSVNQRNILKWEKDEPLGELATISPVLYANVKYPDLKNEFPDWNSRAKQISKLWRKATPDERAPFLSKAKDNRSLLKTSRTRRSDSSKTPTPPVPSEVTESKPLFTTDGENAELAHVESQINVPDSSSSAALPAMTTELLNSALPSSTTVVDSKMVVTTTPVQSTNVDSIPPAPSSQNLILNVQPKLEQVSSDTLSHGPNPFPQPGNSIMTPKVEDSPTKAPAAAGVTRSKSVGEVLSQNTAQPLEDDMKIRRLSVDSQVQQISSHDVDIKPQISVTSSSTQIRPVLHQAASSQRNARRARLWEQSQSNPPPPPYPSVSGATMQTVQGVMYPPIGTRGQVMTIGPRGTLLHATSPVLHNAGMMGFPFEQVPTQAMVTTHPLQQQRPPFPAGVHPISGYRSQHMPGAYIELRHTNESDPAVRRQNILRMLAPQNSPSTESPPTVSQPETKETTTVSTSASSEVKTEAKTAAIPAEVKTGDPFAGGVMPHDEHLDALLRSEEFKDLHFQGGEQEVTSMSSPMATGNNGNAATQSSSAAANESSTSVATSSKNEAVSEQRKSSVEQPDEVIQENQPTPPTEKQPDQTNVTVSTEETDKSVNSASMTTEITTKDSETFKDQHKDPTVQTEPDDIDAGKDNTANNEMDHSYSRSAESDSNDKIHDGVEKSTTEASSLSKGPSPTEFLNREGSQPRGVGLTPPPETEMGFLPSIEEAKRDSASPLTVSNVITVAGSPSTSDSKEKPSQGKDTDNGNVLVKDGKSNVEKMDVDVDPKAGNSDAVQFSEAKDTDMSIFSKSPTSPVAQNLSRFAKVRDPDPGHESKMSEGNTAKDNDEAKLEIGKSPVCEKQGDLETNTVCSTETKNTENEQKVEMILSKDTETQSDTTTSHAAPQGSQLITDIHESGGVPQKEDTIQSTPIQDVEMKEIEQPDEEIQISPIAKMAVDQCAESLPNENVSAPPASDPTMITSSISTSETASSGPEANPNAASTNVTTPVGSTAAVQTAQAPTVSETLIATVNESINQINDAIQASNAVNAQQIQLPVVPEVPQSSVTPQLAQTTHPSTPIPTSTAAAAAITERSVTPQHLTTVSQSATTVPPSTLPVQANTAKDDVQSTANQQKPRTLLIKEQPLILQELLDQEKREQEKARREKLLQSQSMIPQVGAPQPGAISTGAYAVPGVEMEKVAPSESGIDTIKMEFLSRMNEAAKAGLAASPATKGAIMQSATGPMHVHQQPWMAGPIAGAGIQQQGLSHSENETDIQKYGAWLIQQQNLFQMQIPKQEQLMQSKKTRKQSLMKKRNLCKKNGKEFSSSDADELKAVTKQYTEAQQGLEKLRNDQKQHAELMKEFNHRQRHTMEPMTGMVQQAHHVGTIMDAASQQPLIIQHPAPVSIQQQTPQQILVPQFQGPGMQQNISQRQIVMMQSRGQQQQQLVIKSIPASTNVVGPMPSSIASSTLDIQQSTQSVIATQQTQQQQQALIGQFQKIPAMRTGSSGQMQHVRINQPQYQFDQMQILQQQQKMQQTQEQQAKSQFANKDQAASSSGNTGGATAQTHNDLLQMQMQQLMALQMDQEKQMAAQQNPDKPKPKRKRKKKKTQAEKEGEQKLALVTQQMQQTQYMGANQTLPQEWHQHHAMGTNVMQVHPMMGSQQQPRYMPPQLQIPMQPPTPTSTPTIMGPPSQPHTPIQHAPAGVLTGTSHMMTSVSGSHLMTGKQHAPSTSFHSALSVPASPTIVGIPASMPSQGSIPAGVMPIERTSSISTSHTGAPVTIGSSPTSLVKSSPAIDTSNFTMQQVSTSSTLPHRTEMTQVATSVAPTRNDLAVQHAFAQLQTQNSVSPALQGTIQKVMTEQGHTMRTAITTGSTHVPMNSFGPSHQLPLSGRSTPRNQSPRHTLANLDGLSESEIAIIMAHDPDLSDSINKIPSTPTSVLSTPPHQTTVLETEEKSDDTKFKRARKGFVMDSKTIHTIDDSIDRVVRLSVDYDDRLEAAKVSGSSVTTSPWELDPKPTKFPPKRFPEQQQQSMILNQDSVRCLLTHPQYPGMMQAMTPEMMVATQMQKTIPMGMMAYGMKPLEMDVDGGHKKKKHRRSSKEVGPDGKPIKRKKKKDKGLMQPPFPMGTLVEGAIQGVVARPPVQGGQPGVMPPVVPFPGGIVTTGQLPVGHISPGQPAAGDMSKAVSQWKPLPLLKMSEPAIRTSHHMCVPEGTGVTNCKNVLRGLLAQATYANLPDYYELVLELKRRLKPPEPVALISSQPSTPVKISINPEVSITNVITTTTSSAMDVVPSSSSGFSDQSQKYGPLGLDPDGNSTPIASVHDGTQSQIKVPESFPTPPHHGIDEKDDIMKPQKVVDDVVMAPSSPEMDDEDDWEPYDLASLRMDDFSLALNTIDVKSEKIRDCPSPTIPLMRHPKINLPPGRRMLDDKDAVSVTVEFENTNLKNIEKSLTLLSRILGAPIYSFNVVEVPKSSKEIKESLINDVKEEHPATAVAPASQSNQVTNPQQDDGVGQVMQEQKRCCLFCKTVVKKNGIRMPKFNGSAYEEDEIFCNKDCFIKYEFQEKKVSVTPKKKFKVSHVYQRHTNKISMETLLEKYPEEDGLPSKNTRSSVESIYFPNGVQDVTKVGLPPAGRGRGRRRGDEVKMTSKRWKGVKWKKWSTNVAIVKASPKPPVEVEALLVKYGSAMKPPPGTLDKRTCVFCGVKGDGDTNTVARLLNVDVDRWVHLNCALWSAEVYETQGGALINVDLAWRRSESVICCLCQKKGATIHCHRPRCVNTYHCQCAIDIKCAFFKDKTVLCPTHAPKPGLGLTSTSLGMHQSGDTLKSLAVFRKVYVQRPETKQIASIMQQGELTQGEKNFVLRVGALIFENVGQLATHQMADCHSSKAIYPLGYRATRLFWSQTNLRRRCRYECSILEVNGKPSFNMSFKAALPGKNKPDKIVTHSEIDTKLENSNVYDIWMEILSPLEKLRSQHSVLKLFPAHITGEKLFGLTIPVVSRILESLPNIDLCSEYKFRYGRTPLLEVPLAINPTGCARSEPHIRQHRKKPHTLISNLISEYYESSGIGDASSLYGKQFVHSKSSQYRKMKNEWRSNVYLARSRIQGLGLFAARDIEPGTMVIEYIGEIIRTEMSEKREKMYEDANRGVYMFRLDSDHIVDATVTGGPARYINHSCKPNCVAEVVNFEKEKKIMIVSNRHILKGEELSYDYKFDFEDEGRKIPCLCGASNCKKWMN